MPCTTYRNTELYVENVSLKAIADEFGTPCYVYSRAELERNWQAFNQAFQGIPHRICYAVKANGNIGVLNILARLDSGFDIVSLGELQRVIAAGGKPERVVFSGVGKSEVDIEQAILLGVYCFDAESIPELDRLQSIAAKLNKKINVALRVNPDVDPRTHAHISTGLKENKFGIELEEVEPMCKKIVSMSALNLVGIACHIGSQIVELEPFQLAIDNLVELYHRLFNQGIALTHINIGGGLGITYKDEVPPDINDYARIVKQAFGPLPVEIILEPGRAIVGSAGVLLTRIEYIKHTSHHHFAIVDAGMNDLMRPALYDAWQNILPVTQSTATPNTYDVVGPVCESADYLGKRRQLAIMQGDLLAVDTAGAYGFSMSSNYNARGRVAEVLVDGDKVHLVRRRETIADMLSLEHIISE